MTSGPQRALRPGAHAAPERPVPGRRPEVQLRPHGRWPRRSCAPCWGRCSRSCTRSPPSTSWTEPYSTGPPRPPTTCPSAVSRGGRPGPPTNVPGQRRCAGVPQPPPGPWVGRVPAPRLPCRRLWRLGPGAWEPRRRAASCVSPGARKSFWSRPAQVAPGGAPGAGAARGCGASLPEHPGPQSLWGSPGTQAAGGVGGAKEPRRAAPPQPLSPPPAPRTLTSAAARPRLPRLLY